MTLTQWQKERETPLLTQVPRDRCQVHWVQDAVAPVRPLARRFDAFALRSASTLMLNMQPKSRPLVPAPIEVEPPRVGGTLSSLAGRPRFEVHCREGCLHDRRSRRPCARKVRRGFVKQ
jgi:hypothetical protein